MFADDWELKTEKFKSADFPEKLGCDIYTEHPITFQLPQKMPENMFLGNQNMEPFGTSKQNKTEILQS